MSNCIKPTKRFAKYGVLLDPSMFDGLIECQDRSGNRVIKEADGFVLYLASMTCWRELRWFLYENLQPHVIRANVRIPMEVFEESDGFEESFILTAKMFPPGSQLSRDGLNIRDIL